MNDLGAKLLAPLLLLACLSIKSDAQLSNAVSKDEHLLGDGTNKFLTQKADLDGSPPKYDIKSNHCRQHDGIPNVNLDPKWMTEVTSSIYATPLITDLYSDGRKDIVVPSFVHYLEVLEGDDGAQSVGWPAFHKSTVHASPMLYDIDFDGIRDIVVATFDGEVLFFKDTGEKLPVQLTIDRLKVRRDWFVGLDPDPIDHSSPDVKDEDPVEQKFRERRPPAFNPTQTQAGGGAEHSLLLTEEVKQQLKEFKEKMIAYREKFGDAAMKMLLEETQKKNPGFYKIVISDMEKAAAAKAKADGATPVAGTPTDTPQGGERVGSPTLDANRAADAGDATNAGGDSGGGGGAGRRLMSVMEGDEDFEEQFEDGEVAGTKRRLQQDTGAQLAELQEDQKLSGEATESFEVFKDDDYDDDDGLRNRLDSDYSGHIGGKVGDAGDEDGSDKDDSDLSAELGDEYSEEEERALMDGVKEGDADNDRKIIRPDGDSSDAVSSGTRGDGTFKYDDLDGLGDLDYLDHKELFEYDEFGDRFLKDLGAFKGDKDYLLDASYNLLDLVPHADVSALGEGEELNKFNYDHLYLGDYDSDMATAKAKWMEQQAAKQWEEEAFEQAAHGPQDEFVNVDAHVLTNGAMGDIDGDGHEDLVLAVSFFYDQEYYDTPEHFAELKGVDLSKYIASGIVAFDLRTRALKWVQHLDLSTDNTTFKAYAYAAPTLVDVNKDGKLEIVVGASMGFLYLLDHNGQSMEGWPIQMGSIEGQALVADLNNDGEVEIVAGDSHGNIACFNVAGEEIWSRHVRSTMTQGATAADVDGDGELEVVFGTASGNLHVLRGSTGEDLPHFPFRAHGRIHAPILATRIKDGPGQHLIFMAFDGFLYLVDGIDACADVVDVGEMSYSMVLADDLDGNGMLDLLVTTMNGNVYAFETTSEYHPLKAWPAQSMGPNGMVARHDYFGIYATKSSRQARDVAGDKLAVQINILDKRMMFAPNGSLVPRGGPYNVSVVLKGVGVKEMNAGSQPVIGVADTMQKDGIFTVELPCPRTRTTATVHIELTDANGLVVTDEFALSFHLHFHKLFKWIVALPIIVMVLMLMSMNRQTDDMELPSYQHLG